MHGNVSLSEGVFIGIPVAGVIAGTTVQQRLPERAISFMFAILLLAVAVQLVIG